MAPLPATELHSSMQANATASTTMNLPRLPSTQSPQTRSRAAAVALRIAPSDDDSLRTETELFGLSGSDSVESGSTTSVEPPTSTDNSASHDICTNTTPGNDLTVSERLKAVWAKCKLISICACLFTILGFVLNALLVRPSLLGAQYAKVSADLAAWEAAKDFQDMCRNTQIKSTDNTTPECLMAISMSLPPPPLFKSIALKGVSERAIPTLLRKRLPGSTSDSGKSLEKTLVKSDRLTILTIPTVILVWACVERGHHNYVRRHQVTPLSPFDDDHIIVPIGSIITIFSFLFLSSVSSTSALIGLISAFSIILALNLRFSVQLEWNELFVFCFTMLIMQIMFIEYNWVVGLFG